MTKLSGIILEILTHSFLATVLLAFIHSICPENSFGQNLFGSFGFYGGIITAFVFSVSIIVHLITKLIKSK